ncbi:MAG TPA: Gfo/Idh/MocA family oxidoreductase [Chitinophagaceae bacterium]|nr:Gfo/Idh/MocA family oxidoreductase [Chitinophagaceae bacterium]
MNQLKWGFIGSIEKARAFISDVEFATYPHRLQSLLTIDDTTERLPDVDTYADLHQFLQSDVEAVYIASPYTMHYAQAKQCLLHGKAVLCERPVTKNAEELRHLMQLSEHNHMFLMEAMWIRFLPTIKKVLSIISSTAIGEIVSVKASLNYKAGSAESPVPQTGGGALFELGIYPVFLCTLLLGKPEYVQATGRITDSGEDEYFSAFLSYENGQYGFIETNKLKRGDSSAVIIGDKGSIQIKNPWSPKPEGIEVDFYDGTKVVHKSEWKGLGLYFELDEVYESLQQEAIESQLYSQYFSLDVMQTLDDIRKQLS